MKRSSSDIDRPSSASVSSHQLDDFKPELTPPPPETRAKKATPKKKAKMEGSGSSHEGGGGGNGEWTPEKKAVFMDRVIAAGYKVLDLNTLAIELGMSEVQLRNQLAQGRKGSLREKVYKLMEANT